MKGGISINRTWKLAVKTALYLQNKTQKDMAEDLGVSYQYVRGVINGVYDSPKMVAKIEQYCGMKS